MAAKKTITLDVLQSNYPQIVYAKQGDKDSRTIEIALTDNGIAYTIPTGATARIRMTKPDRTTVLNNATVAANKIIITLTEQMLAAAGTATAEIGIYSANTLLTSQIFYIEIEKSAYDSNAVESSNEFGALTNALLDYDTKSASAVAATTAANDAAAAANTSKANADTATANANAAKTAANNAATAANDAAAAANTSKANADTATANVNAAKTAANNAATAANNAATAANHAATAATTAAAEINVKRYGCKRALSSSSPTLTRIYAAEGLTAAIGIGSATVTNDFDNIYPWNQMRRCNIKAVDGEIVVQAYEGDADYATDGSNGEVAVEIPKFYQLVNRVPGDGFEYWCICATPIAGYELNPRFRRSNGAELDRIYIGAYEAYYNSSDESLTTPGGVSFTLSAGLHSISDRHPAHSASRPTFRTRAKTTTAVYGLLDLEGYDVLTTLFTIEFATLNSQSIMTGATNMRYNNVDDTIIAVNSTTSITIGSTGNQYVVGQSVSIGNTQNGTNRTAGVKITDNTASGANYVLTLESAVEGLAVGDFLSTRTWKTGSCDSIAASSGTAANDSKHPMIYRGVENLYGNIWKYIDGINVKDLQSYVCTNPADYTDDSFVAPYVPLSYINAPTEGYAKELGFDVRYPWARITKAVGASSSTYYSDYYYATTGNRVLLAGGYWNHGTIAGLWCFYASNSSSYAYFSLGARLSFKP